MIDMKAWTSVFLLTFVVVISSGCVSRDSAPALPPVYITPCNVIGNNILLEAEGETLSPSIVNEPLSRAFVDDLVNPRTSDAIQTYVLDCWWGKNVGEVSSMYYCGGSYTAPELSSDNVIERYVAKNFKVAFKVEELPGSEWAIDGQVYSEPTKYYLTVTSVEAECTLAS